MHSRFSSLVGAAITLALVAGPVLYAFRAQAQMRNFRVVREGVLYRSGQMSLDGLKRAIHDHGIRTVVSLRDAVTPTDQAEEALCAKEEITFVRLLPQSWDNAEGPAPVEDNVRRFLEVIDDPDNYPILVHCFAGIHRTGAYCAIYRMETEGWSNARAIAEMKACGYDNLDDDLDISTYLRQYRPRSRPGGRELRQPTVDKEPAADAVKNEAGQADPPQGPPRR
jgi:protein tyrosine/serine phosphatase